jgi:hypothetical protein
MRFLPLLAVISLWTASALSQPIIPSTLPLPMNLPVVGLASSETAQVNVVNLAPSGLFMSGSFSTGTTGPCTGTIAFYNAAGSALGNPASFSISTGQVFSATLPYSDVTGTSKDARTVVRATVTTNPPCAVNTNIETYDTMSGVTHVHVEGPATGIFPNLRLGPAR